MEEFNCVFRIHAKTGRTDGKKQGGQKTARPAVKKISACHDFAVCESIPPPASA